MKTWFLRASGQIYHKLSSEIQDCQILPQILQKSCHCTVSLIVGMFVGVYGDVRRVKILYKKPDTALVQMQDPISAQQGKFTCRYLL